MTVGELLLLGFVSQRHGQVLMQEGHGDEAIHLVWSDNYEAACQWLAMAGEAAVSAEQSSEDAVVERGMGEAKWVLASSGDVQAQGQAGQSMWDSGDRRCTVTVASPCTLSCARARVTIVSR
jgi:hypothetical protein